MRSLNVAEALAHCYGSLVTSEPLGITACKLDLPNGSLRASRAMLYYTIEDFANKINGSIDNSGKAGFAPSDSGMGGSISTIMF
jgi:hypothetical protein